MKEGALSGVRKSCRGISRLRYKSLGFRQSSEIHYCNQQVLAIALNLDVASLVLQLMISFQEAPCQGVVCYVLDITLSLRVWCVTSYRSTINIATVSYQYWYYLFLFEMHLLRFICCYCTLIYVINAILLCFICNHCRTLISCKFWINYFVIFSNNCFCCRQINPQPNKSCISSNLAILDTLSPWYDSVCMHTCSPLLRKPLVRWCRTVETGLLLN